MIIQAIAKSGRQGDRVYVNHPVWKIVRKHADPRNVRSRQQEAHRDNVRAVTRRWSPLTPEQKSAWRIFAATHDFMTEVGDRKRLSGYHFFVRINVRRADLGLPQFDLPPAEPVFGPNPVGDLAITNTGDKITIKLPVSGTPAEFILVCGPAPKRSGVRLVQHFPWLGPLPPPVNGYSDITELYVARYGVPKVNQAIWIRTCQHIDGWIDTPKVSRARVRAPAPE